MDPPGFDVGSILKGWGLVWEGFPKTTFFPTTFFLLISDWFGEGSGRVWEGFGEGVGSSWRLLGRPGTSFFGAFI